jgi:ABC-type Fe3+-hydroxamate transport system substrate-binding protein
MTVFKDQMSRSLSLENRPQRIVSLVPSQTELLFDLGLDQEVIGITKFCIHPEHWQQSKTKIGGTKQLHLDKIIALRPDLIIGNKEENDRQQIAQLQNLFPVWMSDIRNLEDALNMIHCIGQLTGKESAALCLNTSIQARFKSLEPIPYKGTAAYLIWKKPYMTAGRNTFIDSMLTFCGLKNVILAERYPEISLKMLEDLNPEFILLSSEPYPFREKHIAEFRQACPEAQIQIVDGELFSWYGSRLQHAPSYYKSLFS